VGKDQHYWFMDHAGTTVAGPWYSRDLGCDGWKFAEGLVVVQVSGECDLIDDNGSIVAQTGLHPLDGVIYPFRRTG
jgi:hypothetical protein